jgi:hypothetical protein
MDVATLTDEQIKGMSEQDLIKTLADIDAQRLKLKEKAKLVNTLLAGHRKIQGAMVKLESLTPDELQIISKALADPATQARLITKKTTATSPITVAAAATTVPLTAK